MTIHLLLINEGKLFEGDSLFPIVRRFLDSLSETYCTLPTISPKFPFDPSVPYQKAPQHLGSGKVKDLESIIAFSASSQTKKRVPYPTTRQGSASDNRIRPVPVFASSTARTTGTLKSKLLVFPSEGESHDYLLLDIRPARSRPLSSSYFLQQSKIEFDVVPLCEPVWSTAVDQETTVEHRIS